MAQLPRLLATYLAFKNHPVALLRERWLTALALLVPWFAAAVWISASPATAARLQRHVFLLAGLSALAACVLVSRRRSLHRAEAAHSWLAALPATPATARCESICIETSPVLALALLTTPLLFAHLGLAVIGGLLIGTLVSYAVPAAKGVELLPGSRYVPQRRRRRDPIPAGSLNALGWWPVRRMFASARPQTVARAAVPIMLAMPLGSRADAAMLLFASLGVAGAVALLLSAFVAVHTHSRRWLRPLPLNPHLLLWTVLKPGVAVLICAAALETWFLWLMRAPG